MAITGPQKQEATFGVRAAGFVTFFFFFLDWLVGGNRAVLQESCVQSEVTILHLGGGYSSVEELKDIDMDISLSKNQDPVSRLYHHLIVSSLFLYPLPSLISNSLIPPFGTQGRSRSLNKAYILQTRKENAGQNCTPEPHRVLLNFNLGNWATMTVIISCQNGAQDCLSLEN